MKKSFLILSVLVAATIANAQITLEHSFDGVYFNKSDKKVTEKDDSSIENVDFPFFYSYTNPDAGSTTDIQITFVNPFDYSIYKTVNLNYEQIVGHPCTDTYTNWDTGEEYTSSYGNNNIFAFTYNVFVPNKIAFIVPITTFQGMGYYIYGYYIVDEDGVVHKSFLKEDGYADAGRILVLTKIRNEYKLIAYKYIWHSDTWYEQYFTEIYSLPGNGGDYMGTANPSSPKRNARKYINENQVMIDNNKKTYTIQGQEVK